MKSLLLRVLLASIAAAPLAACSSGSSTLPTLAQPSAQFAGALPGGTNASPCKVPNAWYFRGACLEFSLPNKGKTVTLDPYHGLTIVEHIGPNSAYPPKNNQFVVGVGTSDSDITGTNLGAHFPEYGKVQCFMIGGTSTPCKGTALFYSLMLNDSEVMALGKTPMFRVSASPKAFPGATCEEALIGYTTSHKWAWVELGVYAKPVNGVATFKPTSGVIDLDHDAFEAFAFHCF